MSFFFISPRLIAPPVCLLSFAFCFPLSAEEAHTIPRLKQKPVIDGQITEDEWAHAARLDLLLPIGNAKMPKTVAWVGFTETALYLAVRSEEPFPAKVRTVTIPDEKNGDVEGDDHIHLAIDPGNTGRQDFYNLLINSQGTLFHSRNFGIRVFPGGWESGAQVRARMGGSFWEVEAEIPLESLGHAFQKGELIGLNIARIRHASQSDRPALSSLAQPFNQHFKALLPFLVEGAVKDDKFTLVSAMRGPFSQRENGEWRFEIEAKQPLSVSAEFPEAPAGGKLDRTVPVAKGRQQIAFPITGEDAPTMRKIRLKVDGREVFSSEHRLTAEEDLNASVIVTEDPLFEELLEPYPESLAKEGFIQWRHELEGFPVSKNGRRRMFTPQAFSQRTGREYSKEKIYETWGKQRSIIIVTPGQLTPEHLALADRFGVRWAVTARFQDGKGATAPLNGSNLPWLLDPRCQEGYLDSIRQIVELAKNEKSIWGIMAGDEAWEKMRSGFRHAQSARERAPYPEFEAADADAKARFGFGKYGFPVSLADMNPFAWIATSRWEADQMFALQKKARAIVQEGAPRLKMVSWNPQGRYPARDYHRWPEVFDIVNVQVSSDMGFYTKLAADLSQAKDLWVCTHIEHYLGNYTRNETEELLSEVFRNGSTGLHLYMVNTMKRRSGAGSALVDQIGAPERWNVVENTLEQLRKSPFRVRQAEPDTGVFISNISYLSKGNYPNPKTDDLRMLYNVMGPQLQQAFTYFDESGERLNSLDGYKAIFVPYAPVVDDETYQALENFVAKGGLLVSFDPLAFRHRSDGSKRAKGALLAPVSSTEGETPQKISSQWGDIPLEAIGQRYSMEVKGKTIARFTDGTAAILEVPHEKGRIIFVGQSPLTTSLPKSKGWQSWFADLKKEYQGATSKTWRFRFPSSPEFVEQRPQGECLTGNFFQWRQSEPQLVANAAVAGGYTLSQTDRRRLEEAGKEIPFSQGRLTDRFQGALAENAAEPNDFLLSFNASEQPLEIVLRFDKPVKAGWLRLFTSRPLPAGRLEALQAEGEWKTVGEWNGNRESSDEDVLLTEVKIKKNDSDRFRLVFAPQEDFFDIAEIDLWGENIQ